jgi:hypothetical protein
MNKRLMVPFLTEWLILHGSDPVYPMEIGLTVDDGTWMKMHRLGYLATYSDSKRVYLTNKGKKYLQENQK